MDTTIWILIAIGLTAGFGSGLFGIGGGVVIVPALIYLIGFSQHKATGTSLVVLLPPVGIGAVLEYSRHGNVEWRAALIVAVTMLVGATLGAIVANKLSGPALRLGFGIFMVGLGFYTVYGAINRMRQVGSQQAQHASAAEPSQPKSS